jgi:hypothetical protein
MIQRRLQNHNIIPAVLINLPHPGLAQRVGAELPVVLDSSEP